MLGEYAEYDPQDAFTTGAFVAALNSYMRDELKFGQDKTYLPGSDEAGNQWDWKHHGPGDNFGFPGSPNVEGDLIQALLTNPRLQVEVENGLYDLATPFYATEYTMDHLLLPEKLRGNIHLQYYGAGHMIYVRDEDRGKLKNNVASFIEGASKP
jgi:carboxypeptidase C (cathepsin A)